MALLMGLMMIGNKHGQHALSMVKKNAYVGHKCGAQKTWMTMSEFCHYHMILMLWQVSTMMWLKLVKTSFKAWLQIQGVTISLFMRILFFIVCCNQKYLIAFWHLWISCSCGALLWYTLNLEHFGTFKSIEENMKWGFGVNFYVEMIYYQSLCSHYQTMGIQFNYTDNLWWEFLKFHLWHSN